MTDLHVVVEPNTTDGPDAKPWVYGIFNDREDAEKFVAWVTQDDEFENSDEYIVVRITAAWSGGLIEMPEEHE